MKKILTTILVAALGLGAWGGTVTVGGTAYDTFADAITAAKAIGGAITYTINGEVELKDYTDIAPDPITSVTIIGASGASADTVKITGTYRVRIVTDGTEAGTGKPLTVKNLSLVDAVTGGQANAWEGTYFAPTAAQSTFENVTFNEGIIFWSGCNATLKNCTFDPVNNTGTVSSHYMVWVEGDSNVTIDGCTFTDLCVRGVKCEYRYYPKEAAESEKLEHIPNVTIKDTTFNMPENSKKPAVVASHLDSITLEGNTYPPTGVFELDSGANGATVTADIADIACKSDDLADCGVLVDGKIYLTVTDANAANAITEGSKVTLYYSPEANNEANVEFPKGSTLVDNGYTASNIILPAVPVTNSVQSANLFGAIKISGNTAANMYVAVPFEGFASDGAARLAKDVVHPANLTAETKMYVYNTGADSHDVYTVASGAWTPATKVTIDSNNAATLESAALDREVGAGSGVLVERKSTTDAVYVYGQIPSAGTNSKTFGSGRELVAPPYTNATVEVSGVQYVNLNAAKWTNVQAAQQNRKLISGADFIQFRDANNRLIKYYYDGTSWGLQPTYAKLASYAPFVANGQALVPQGTAFWYCSSVGGAKVEWTK